MVQKSRVAMLKMSKLSLKGVSMEMQKRKDVFAFCSNILHAHRTNAFGGKPALWDFLKDVATNINWAN